ncbi:hypothetical protein PLEOSDRAFT_1102690 [Pleurotus ostreatus PC15]|uniref:Uncharacterized protein n=1 Tax=Pleurotus ostreatus (strain PC15) TaxID=1137138 RepID=A0A067NYF4_PLEO1|nr:hypothetical protein PLEOSDRAFT_1102690 [Pleurotus ostreatus PC15]
MSIAPQVNPSINTAVAAFEASELNTQAYQAQRSGNLQEAERRYLLAIELKEPYLKMGKKEEAADNLTRAKAAISETETSSFNAAVTREDFAQIAQMKGVRR